MTYKFRHCFLHYLLNLSKALKHAKTLEKLRFFTKDLHPHLLLIMMFA